MDAGHLAFPFILHSDVLTDTIEACKRLHNAVDLRSSRKDFHRWSQNIWLVLDTLLNMETVLRGLLDSPDELDLLLKLDSISIGKLLLTFNNEVKALQFIFDERTLIDNRTPSVGDVADMVLISSSVETKMGSVLEKLQLLCTTQPFANTVRSEQISKEIEKITLDIKYSTLEDSDERLGFEHPDTLAIASDIGLTLHRNGSYHAAEFMYRRVLAAQEQVLGSASSVTLKSINDLAEVLQSQGKPEEAEKMFRRASFRRQHLSDMERPSSGQLRWKVSNEGSLISDYIRSLVGSPEAVEIGLSVSAAAALSRKLQGATAHKTRIAKFRAVSFRSKAQTLLESLLGIPLEWWPLPEPQRPLPAGLASIVWTCVSKSTIWSH